MVMSDALLIVLYLALIVLVIVSIVAVIRFIGTLSKIDILVDNITKKAQTLDGVFNTIDHVSNAFGSVGEKVGSYLSTTVKKIIKRKGKEEEDDE